MAVLGHHTRVICRHGHSFALQTITFFSLEIRSFLVLINSKPRSISLPHLNKNSKIFELVIFLTNLSMVCLAMCTVYAERSHGNGNAKVNSKFKILTTCTQYKCNAGWVRRRRLVGFIQPRLMRSYLFNVSSVVAYWLGRWISGSTSQSTD